MGCARFQDSILLLQLHVQPGGKSDCIVGIHGDRLKVRLQAPPVDGKANARLIDFLAAQFGVPKSAVQITRGRSGRAKTLSIVNPGTWPDWYRALNVEPPASVKAK